MIYSHLTIPAMLNIQHKSELETVYKKLFLRDTLQKWHFELYTCSTKNYNAYYFKGYVNHKKFPKVV